MNDNLIFSDGNTVYITLESKIRTWVKVLLIVLNIGLYCIPIFLLWLSSETKDGSLVFAALAMSGVLFYYLTRPTLWNVFGRESIIITTENLSYYRDFGFYKSQIRNINIAHGLAAYIENELAYEDEPYIVITFCEYLPDGEYREILTTGIKTQEENYNKIVQLLDELFEIPENIYEFSAN